MGASISRIRIPGIWFAFGYCSTFLYTAEFGMLPKRNVLGLAINKSTRSRDTAT